jgi:DNA-cytosine methyltransferase
MNVLSLFDGMSCGQQALERANIKVSQYFASEIDKYAIKVTMANYPNTIQLGSVVNVKGADLPKIDMLIGGSPCQSFSFAGKRKGMATKCNQEILTLEQYLELKEQGFEFEGQSYLFWEYVRVLNEVKPKYFLLENVMMEERWEKIISKTLGVHPVEINSSLLSAQNRRRLYWTNIGLKPSGLFGDLESTIKQPKDKGILLKDILEDEVDEKYFLSEKMINGFSERNINHNEKGNAITNPGKNRADDNYIFYNNKRLNKNIEKHKNELEHHTLLDSYNQTIHKDKSITISTRIDASGCTHIVHSLQPRSGDPKKGGTGHLSKSDGKTYCLDTGNSQAVEVISGTLRTHIDGNGFREVKTGKAATILARAREDGSGQNVVSINSQIRRLTPIECERLQTVKDNYTNHVSDSQRYKMLGNGWTVDVIAYIFGYIE